MKYLKLGLFLALCSFASGCGYDSWAYRSVPNITISRPDDLDNEGRLVLKVEPDATSLQTPAMVTWLHEHPAAAGRRTVLMASRQHKSLFYSHTMGQTLLVFLEGAPKRGEYWLTPDNSVLITYSAFSTPQRERVALVGSVTIQEIKPQEILAKVAVKDTTQIDTSLFLDEPWDPINQQWPYELNGTYEFSVTQPGDPLFQKSAVKWVSHEDVPIVAQR